MNRQIGRQCTFKDRQIGYVNAPHRTPSITFKKLKNREPQRLLEEAKDKKKKKKRTNGLVKLGYSPDTPLAL